MAQRRIVSAAAAWAAAAFLGVGMALAVGLNAKAQDLTDFEPENTIIITVGLGYGEDSAEATPARTGEVVIRLLPELAPAHVERIKTLARENFYDGVPFHRVIAGFMAQTGDPTGTGRGGSEYPDLPAEFTNTPFERGTLGMARTPEPNSANSQFFITFDRADFLDGQYTVFGVVLSGMEVVDEIKREPADRNGVVSGPRDRMVSVRVAADIGWTPPPAEEGGQQ